MTHGAATVAGARACLPIAVSVVPFAVAYAVAAMDAGLPVERVVGMSLLVFAGASQLTAIGLVDSGAPWVMAVGAAAVVNLRMLMYSASMAPHVRATPTGWRAGMAYLLTDQAFAISLPRLEARDAGAPAFYVGAGLALWLAWQLGTLLGLAVGAGVPESVSLDFAVSLAFIALAVPALDRPSSRIAALSSVGVFLAASSLPFGLALLPAAAAGVLAGRFAERRFEASDAGEPQ